MKKAVVLVVGLAGWVFNGYCQLPASTLKSAETSGTIVAVLNNDNSGLTLLGTVGHQRSIKKIWKYEAEVSTIERVYPHAISFVSRDHHVSAYGSVTRAFHDILHVSVSCFAIWDPKKINPVTEIWTATGNFTLRNGASVTTSIQNRSDEVNEQFSFADQLTIKSRHHQFQTLTVGYSGSSKRRVTTYAESSAGSYYGFSRYALRMGERIRFFHDLSFMADIELNHVINTFAVDGVLARLKTEWQINPLFTASVFSIHNSYSQRTAIMSSLQFQKANHTVKVEYRELRDQSLQYIETNNFWFSSRVLLQYTYRIASL